LISTNDSRIRLYTLRDKSVICKFIGHQNDTSQIKGSLSDDGEYVISGSEDNRTFIWNIENRYAQRSVFSRTPLQHVKSCEYFETHSKPVTCALFAPSSVRNRLQSVGLRPVYSGNDLGEGQIVVAVDLNGKIKIYENNSLLESWLSERE
jgi:WD40 repeat protein